jgi:glucose-1-phosphate cytidylyltransferase
MKVVILCGGYGLRIRDVSENIPKPMISIGGEPILMHIMRYYAHFGLDDFVLCLGYKGDVIKDFFLNYEVLTRDFTIQLGGEVPKLDFHNERSELEWRVTLADTGLDAMTGARIRKVQRYIGNDDDIFMLTYGDGLGDVDLAKLLAFHKSHDKLLTVTGVRPPGRFGELVKGDDGRVTEFNEKPQATSGLISGGFFVARQGVFDYLGRGDDVVFEQEPIRNLVRDQQMMVYEHNGFWQPMDTHRDYQLLNKLYESGAAPWVVWR